jgi:GMP synthase (glutamine-hydrolysing)
VAIALLNALSAPLCATHQPGFARLNGRLPLQAFWGLGQHLTVIGCGGYLEEAVQLPWLQKVSCIDLNFCSDERRLRYQPFIEQVLDPQRSHLEIQLDDGSKSQPILAQTDILCVSGSTLCNDTLPGILEQAPNCKAIILEGHSAGIWPGLLTNFGIHHLVQTPLDLPVPDLMRRYASQLEQGIAQLGPGPYFDTLFPQRQTLVSIAGSPAQKGSKFLLLQARDSDDPMISHERECFERGLECPVEYRSLLDGALRSEELEGCAAVLIGGSGRYGAANNREFWFETALESLRLVLRKEVPILASCWGIQALATALGGRVEARPEYAEYGTISLQLTHQGQQDPIFQGWTGTMSAQAGHSETVTHLPQGVELLATSEGCPTQMFRLPNRHVYACQFHPELSAADLQYRVAYYGVGPKTELSPEEHNFGAWLLQRFRQLIS